MITNLDLKHSADMCIFTVKSVIKYYTGQNTPVCTRFLDSSKAFDQVNHWTLLAQAGDVHINPGQPSPIRSASRA